MKYTQNHENAISNITLTTDDKGHNLYFIVGFTSGNTGHRDHYLLRNAATI